MHDVDEVVPPPVHAPVHTRPSPCSEHSLDSAAATDGDGQVQGGWDDGVDTAREQSDLAAHWLGWDDVGG